MIPTLKRGPVTAKPMFRSALRQSLPDGNPRDVGQSNALFSRSYGEVKSSSL